MIAAVGIELGADKRHRVAGRSCHLVESPAAALSRQELVMPTFQFEAMDATGQEIRDVIDAEDQEESIGLGRPHSDAIPIPIPNSFYTEHEVMLSRLAKEYRCDIEDLTPVVNLVRS